MIQIEDLRKGLQVVRNDGMKAIIVKWEVLPARTVYALGCSIDIPVSAHVQLNTNQYWWNSHDPRDRDIVTWGESNKDLLVDMEYYQQLTEEGRAD